MADKLVFTNVAFDAETLEMLRDLARLRARLLGGRVSASAVVRDLVRDAAAEKLPARGGDTA